MRQGRLLRGKDLTCPRCIHLRLLFFVVILLGHAAVISLMRRSIYASRAASEAHLATLPIYVMPLATPQLQESRRVDAAASVQRQTTPPRQSRAIAIPQPPQEGTAIQVPEPRVALDVENRGPDWAREAEKSVQQLARLFTEPRAFGKAPKNIAAPDEFRDRAIEANPHRRAGYVEVLGPGYERHWLSSRCYREFGGQPALLAGSGFRVHPITCLVGGGSADGDLLDHLKPDYLRQ